MLKLFRSRSPPAMDDSDGEEATFTCRICFEDCKPSELIAPCKCKGTLKYVHQSCLHKWQTNVHKLGGKKDDRATICSVCRTRYTSLPPTAAAHTLLKIWSCAKSLMGAFCIALLALCLSGPPLLHLLLLLVLLLGSRSQSVLVILIMMFGGVMASLYARGLRLVLRKEGDMRIGIAVIRHGAPVEGLRVGSLLVAHDSSLAGTFFAQSVVLLTEMNARGAKGVVLTQPIDSIDSDHLLSPHYHLLHRLATASPIQHFLGGPVGLPHHSGPAGQAVVLHHHGAAVQGAAAVLQTPPAAAAAQGVESSQQRRQLQLDVQRQRQRWCLRWAKFCVMHELQQRRQQRGDGVPDVPAATAAVQSRRGGSSSSSSDGDRYAGLNLYQGGSLDEILRAAQQHSSHTAATAAAGGSTRGSLASRLRNINRNAVHNQQQQQRAASTAGSTAALTAVVRMYHGVCVWSAGQLEGEVRAGAWGYVSQADVTDVVITSPQILWQQLLHSNRTQWL